MNWLLVVGVLMLLAPLVALGIQMVRLGPREALLRLDAWVERYRSRILIAIALFDLIGAFLVIGVSIRQQQSIDDVNQTAMQAKRAAFVATEAARVANHQAEDLRQGLIKGCRKNGNPIRAALRQNARQQIEQDRNTALFQQLLPSLTPDELHSLIHKTIAESQRQIRQFHPLDCKALYPDHTH